MGGLAKPTISVGTDIVPGPRSLPLQLRDAAFPFIVGGASGMVATTCIQPIDMVKVRLQLVDESIRTGPKPTPISVVREVVANGRILDLYSGLSAGLLRQVVYGTARLGFFFTFEDRLKARAKKDGRQVTFGERALASLSAGGLGAIIGNPTEVALIRMQSDGMKPEAQRANYRSVFDALLRTTREEGVRALWSGSSATVVRAMSTNFGQLAFFSQAKHQLRQVEKISEHSRTLTAAAIAGFFAAFFSLPFDFAKTRLQQRTKAANGALQYKSMPDCFIKVARTEGLLRFYRGFWTYFFRIAPHSMISLVVADNLTRILK